ncbi:putative 3-isopropylmalate dehydratase [Helianthus annuus]|nr:putative 3-isopropylmalate dehydratase [Helianthus annuus]
MSSPHSTPHFALNYDWLKGVRTHHLPNSPSCGACLGGPLDTYACMNEPQVCLSTTNRNFPGRMGHKEGQIYLASPYTAVASALTGFVTDPRDFLH